MVVLPLLVRWGLSKLMLDIAVLVGWVGSTVVWVILNILALIHTSVLAWRSGLKS